MKIEREKIKDSREEYRKGNEILRGELLGNIRGKIFLEFFRKNRKEKTWRGVLRVLENKSGTRLLNVMEMVAGFF